MPSVGCPGKGHLSLRGKDANDVATVALLFGEEKVVSE